MKSFRERNPIPIGVFGAVFLLVVGLLTLNWERLPVIGGKTYTAEFAEAAGLKPDNEVRIGGVKVGDVTDVELAGENVLVTFRVASAWIGDRSTASIEIKTLLGQKTLAIEPAGSAELDPDKPIPASRTKTPYDVNDAFGDLSDTVGEIDAGQLAESFTTLADTMDSTTPKDVRAALDGLSALSKTISSRDRQLAKLLGNTSEISKTMADQRGNIAALMSDGKVLLGALQSRRDAIGKLLNGTRELAVQLDGVVSDNAKQLKPALDKLDRVNTVLSRNKAKLDKSLGLAGPFYRLIGESVDNGPWIDNYLCGLVGNGRPRGDCMPPKPKGGS